ADTSRFPADLILPPAPPQALSTSTDISQPALSETESAAKTAPVVIASGEKAKARDILAAIRVLKTIEQDNRAAIPEERQVLARFAGFGPVALSIFPDPVTGHYK